MICTITPPPDCLARLAACPALPRGERLEWAQSLDRPHFGAFYTARSMAQANQVAAPTRTGMVSRWRSMARPLRVARERLREARRVIDGVAMDMDDASYREDDCSHVRAMKKARDDLYAALRTP